GRRGARASARVIRNNAGMHEPATGSPVPHMTPEEFREVGRRVVDWIAEYMARAGDFPVRSAATPGQIASMLPESAPERGEGWDAILNDLERVVLPGITHWQRPRFFGYFPDRKSGVHGEWRG